MKTHSTIDTLRFGTPLASAKAAVILLHGRGSSPEDIAGLARVLPEEGIAYFAPAAETGAWYPQRFFVPLGLNEPWLSDALNVISGLVAEAQTGGLESTQIGIAGFSQGGCLALEYAIRHPQRYGFIGGLSGALIGPLETARKQVDLKATPLLVACAENDAHIPLPYVEQSARILGECRAEVTKQIFPGSAHTVFPDEIAWLTKQYRSLTG